MKNIIAIICFLSVCFCSYSEIGSSFRLGASAREISLSNALVANYNPGFNAFSNPALLNKITKAEYGFSLFSLSLDRSIQSFSFAVPLPPIATLGLSMFRSSTNNIQGYDGLGNSTESKYKTYDAYAMASFAIKIKSLFAGVNFKLFNSKLIDGVHADGIGFDLGLYFEINDKNNIGLKISDMSSKYNWSFDYNNFNQQYEEKHPMYISISHSSLVYFSSGDLLILSQVDLFDSNKQNMKLGFEYKLVGIEYPCYFRIGTKLIKNYDLVDYNLTFGFGMPFKINNMNMMFDYAVDPGIMYQGISHIISFSFLK